MRQFSVTWDSFKANICNGFIQLQQSGDFVDMTIAADGHVVKVHQNIVALASSYIKEILQTAPCPHPIIFLANISHETLDYILQYIYTGEVQIPNKHVGRFCAAAKALHIKGVENMFVPKQFEMAADEIFVENNDGSDTNKIKISSLEVNQENINNKEGNTEANNDMDIEITVNNQYDDTILPDLNDGTDNLSHFHDYDVELHKNIITNLNQSNANIYKPVTRLTDTVPYANNVTDSVTQSAVGKNDNGKGNNHAAVPEENGVFHPGYHDAPENSNYNIEKKSTAPSDQQPIIQINFGIVNQQGTVEFGGNGSSSNGDNKMIENANVNTPLYTISIRGCLQLILNSYMYYLHNSTKNKRKRWRCIDYRRKGCKALVDTCGDLIVNRIFTHNHANHDEKILQKARMNLLIPTLSEAVKKSTEFIQEGASQHTKNKLIEIGTDTIKKPKKKLVPKKTFHNEKKQCQLNNIAQEGNDNLSRGCYEIETIEEILESNDEFSPDEERLINFDP